MDAFPSRHAASVYCAERAADAASLAASVKLAADVWDFGYARVHLEPKGLVRVVSRQGLTLAEGFNVTLSQIHAFLLRRFW